MIDSIILIPYRNRKEHLDIFIKEVVPLFRKYLKSFKVVVIEQIEGKPFNRGKLINIGFKEFIHQALFYFHHDVDIIPKETTVKILYTIKNFDVLRLYCGHNKSCGGVIKLTETAFLKMNGFPNYIWGWGFEDVILFYRASVLKLNMTDNLANMSNFKMLDHESNAKGDDEERIKLRESESELYNNKCYHEQLTYIKKFGLSDLKYQVIESKKISDDVILIKVDI